MTLLETEVEIEVRCYKCSSENGNFLNTKWLKKDDKQMKTLFPNLTFADSVWVETKEQADYLEVSFENLADLGYEVFLCYS